MDEIKKLADRDKLDKKYINNILEESGYNLEELEEITDINIAEYVTG